VDETGHTFRARVGTTWAPTGQAPVLRRVSKRRELSSLVALTAPLDGRPAHLYARHVLGTVHAQEVLVALRYFRRQIGHPLLVVWDHLNAHQARRVRDFLGAHAADFAIEWLPGYAPELNPEELCNQWVKHDLLNSVPGSIDELRRLVRGRFARLRHQPDVLQGFFAHAGLPVN
jgi:DDE superfamily endonuclease